MYLTQPLHRAVQQTPEAIHSVYRDRALSHRQVRDRVARIAGGLRARGVRTDSRVGLLSLNTDTFFHVCLAIAWADAVVVPLNTRWSAKEMSYALSEADVEVLFADDPFLGLAAELRDGVPGLREIICTGDSLTPDGLTPLADLLAAEPVEDAHRQGAELAGIFYTGGTTGLPKGVMLSHRGIFTSALGSLTALARIPRGGGNLLVAPAFHMAGFAIWVQGMLLQMTAVPLPGFDPVGVLKAIEEHRIKQSLLVPTMIQMLVDHPEARHHDLSSVESLVYGASPISEAVLDRARKVFSSAAFTQAYGMTELSPTTTILSDQDHADPVLRRSAGRAAPYARVKIVGPDDEEVPRGTVGEIIAAGDHVMLGYWKQPVATAEAVRDGWMHTGDGGYMDERGYVYVVDRIKDMIISGGENVYSIEVENVVAKHPAVAQVAVIGVPDDVWGERVHAVVTLTPGSALDLAELREFCKQEIAGYKAPRSLDVVAQLPLSGAGKVLKRTLREQHRH
jgi:acyl-CoA synthetase (AMP-forming)/AMP-acid ligase II